MEWMEREWNKKIPNIERITPLFMLMVWSQPANKRESPMFVSPACFRTTWVTNCSNWPQILRMGLRNGCENVRTVDEVGSRAEGICIWHCVSRPKGDPLRPFIGGIMENKAEMVAFSVKLWNGSAYQHWTWGMNFGSLADMVIFLHNNSVAFSISFKGALISVDWRLQPFAHAYSWGDRKT